MYFKYCRFVFLLFLVAALLPTTVKGIESPRLKVVVGFLDNNVFTPKVLFKPLDTVSILCIYEPYYSKLGDKYFHYFNYSLEVFDPTSRKVFSKTGLIREEVSGKPIWEKYFTFKMYKMHYTGVYSVRMIIYDFVGNKYCSGIGYFLFVNGTPLTVKFEALHFFQLGNPHKSDIKIDVLYVALIPNTMYQKVLEGPYFSVNPCKIIFDKYGNKYAIFENIKLKPNEYFNLSIRYVLFLEAKCLNLNLSRRVLNQIPSTVQVFLKPSPKIESDNELIKSKAIELTQGKETIGEMLYSIGSFVDNHIKYKEMKEETSALQAFLTGEGDCSEFSMLFTALARASGIPCRIVIGYAFIYPYLCEKWKKYTTTHAWCEAYIHGAGWLPIEPQAPNSIGSTAPSGYYITLCRCPREEVIVYGNKIKVRILYRVYKGLYSIVQYYIWLKTVKRNSPEIKVTVKKYSKGYIYVEGKTSKDLDKLQALILKPDNSTSLAEINVKDGYFTLKRRAAVKGEYRIYFFYKGNEEYSETFAKTSIATVREKSSLKIYYNKRDVEVNDTIELWGKLEPLLPNQIIVVTCIGPNSLKYSYITITDENGEFNVKIKLSKEGEWVIKFYWSGNQDYLPCEETIKVNAYIKQVEKTSQFPIDILLAVLIVIVVIVIFLRIRKRS